MKKLTFSDVEPIILALSDTDVVLVGGQAIAAWCNIYNLEMAINAITRDIDFYGGSSAVENANNKLKIYHSKAYYPDLDDNTPNSGKISCMLNNDAIEIDFMYSLTGLSDDEIESSSVTVELQGKAFKILHPWLCLQSKIVNLAVHIGKRDNEGIEQARLSVEIMHAFLVDLVKEDTKSAIKFCEKIFKFCERESSLFANNLY